MANIDGRAVISSGVFQFQDRVSVNAGSAPPIEFRTIDTGRPCSEHTEMVGNTLTITVDLQPFDYYSGTQNYKADGTDYTLLFVVTRLRDLPDGRFYEVRYSVTLQ